VDDRVEAVLAEPIPRLFQSRMAPLFLALRDAASTEPEAKEVWQQISHRRATNMRRLVRALGDDALRAGLDVDEAADVVWATASSELFVLLTGERGWTLDRYQQFLTDTWHRSLLRHPTP
jgi:hypothetical protein